ncbi:hypothetical protein U9M48_001684 [Paspalum notatum var. saurae]|uniref:Uncharacterized protein n=1 Tax=Paspalum notatum var. saurae TaxID=547442 RepID=A0AAQ3SFE2_PASNO
MQTRFLPFRYLGILMHFKKLSNKDWKAVEDRFEKRLSGWKRKLIPVGGRQVLINIVLSSLPMCMLSFFEVPRDVLRKMDYYRSRSYSQNDQHKKKYRLARWEIFCQPIDQGGLGIINLNLQNKCLLSKSLFRLCNEDGMWQQLIRNKYLKNKTLSQVKQWDPSYVLERYMVRRPTFKNTNFLLHLISFEKNATVAEVLCSLPLNKSFRRALTENKLT